MHFHASCPSEEGHDAWKCMMQVRCVEVHGITLLRSTCLFANNFFRVTPSPQGGRVGPLAAWELGYTLRKGVVSDWGLHPTTL